MHYKQVQVNIEVFCHFIAMHYMSTYHSNLSGTVRLFQSEGSSGSGSPWLPGRAGHPAAMDRWRTSTTDHQSGHQLCLWPVSQQMHGRQSVDWFPSVGLSLVSVE